MDIRRAVPDDAMSIASVHVRSWQAAYPGLLPQDYLDELRPEHRVGGWSQVLQGTDWPRAGVFVLVDGESSSGEGSRPGEVVGFCHLCPTRDDDRDRATTGEVTSIYLAPEAWGAGNGVALLAVAIDEMTEAGYTDRDAVGTRHQCPGTALLRDRWLGARRSDQGQRLGTLRLHRRPVRARPRQQALRTHPVWMALLKRPQCKRSVAACAKLMIGDGHTPNSTVNPVQMAIPVATERGTTGLLPAGPKPACASAGARVTTRCG